MEEKGVRRVKTSTFFDVVIIVLHLIYKIKQLPLLYNSLSFTSYLHAHQELRGKKVSEQRHFKGQKVPFQ